MKNFLIQFFFLSVFKVCTFYDIFRKHFYTKCFNGASECLMITNWILFCFANLFSENLFSSKFEGFSYFVCRSISNIFWESFFWEIFIQYWNRNVHEFFIEKHIKYFVFGEHFLKSSIFKTFWNTFNYSWYIWKVSWKFSNNISMLNLILAPNFLEEIKQVFKEVQEGCEI